MEEQERGEEDDYLSLDAFEREDNGDFEEKVQLNEQANLSPSLVDPLEAERASEREKDSGEEDCYRECDDFEVENIAAPVYSVNNQENTLSVEGEPPQPLPSHGKEDIAYISPRDAVQSSPQGEREELATHPAEATNKQEEEHSGELKEELKEGDVAVEATEDRPEGEEEENYENEFSAAEAAPVIENENSEPSRDAENAVSEQSQSEEESLQSKPPVVSNEEGDYELDENEFEKDNLSRDEHATETETVTQPVTKEDSSQLHIEREMELEEQTAAGEHSENDDFRDAEESTTSAAPHSDDQRGNPTESNEELPRDESASLPQLSRRESPSESTSEAEQIHSEAKTDCGECTEPPHNAPLHIEPAITQEEESMTVHTELEQKESSPPTDSAPLAEHAVSPREEHPLTAVPPLQKEPSYSQPSEEGFLHTVPLLHMEPRVPSEKEPTPPSETDAAGGMSEPNTSSAASVATPTVTQTEPSLDKTATENNILSSRSPFMSARFAQSESARSVDKSTTGDKSDNRSISITSNKSEKSLINSARSAPMARSSSSSSNMNSSAFHSPVAKLRGIVLGAKSVDFEDKELQEAQLREAREAAERLQRLRDAQDRAEREAQLRQKEKEAEEARRLFDLQQRTGRAKSVGFSSIKAGLFKKDYEELREKSPIKPSVPIPRTRPSTSAAPERDNSFSLDNNSQITFSPFKSQASSFSANFESSFARSDNDSLSVNTRGRAAASPTAAAGKITPKKKRLSFVRGSLSGSRSIDMDQSSVAGLLPCVQSENFEDDEFAAAAEAAAAAAATALRNKALSFSLPTDESADNPNNEKVQRLLYNHLYDLHTPSSDDNDDIIASISQKKERDKDVLRKKRENAVQKIKTQTLYTLLQSEDLIANRFGWNRSPNKKPSTAPVTLAGSKPSTANSRSSPLKMSISSSKLGSSLKNNKIDQQTAVVVAAMDYIPGFDPPPSPMDDTHAPGGLPLLSRRSTEKRLDIHGTNESPGKKEAAKDGPESTRSIFYNYSGMLYRDPTVPSTWRELNMPPQEEEEEDGLSTKSRRTTTAPDYTPATKRQLRAGRMINSYRPWGPERPKDPLEELLQKQKMQQMSRAAAVRPGGGSVFSDADSFDGDSVSSASTAQRQQLRSSHSRKRSVIVNSSSHSSISSALLHVQREHAANERPMQAPTSAFSSGTHTQNHHVSFASDRSRTTHEERTRKKRLSVVLNVIDASSMRANDSMAFSPQRDPSSISVAESPRRLLSSTY